MVEILVVFVVPRDDDTLPAHRNVVPLVVGSGVQGTADTCKKPLRSQSRRSRWHDDMTERTMDINNKQEEHYDDHGA